MADTKKENALKERAMALAMSRCRRLVFETQGKMPPDGAVRGMIKYGKKLLEFSEAQAQEESAAYGRPNAAPEGAYLILLCAMELMKIAGEMALEDMKKDAGHNAGSHR